MSLAKSFHGPITDSDYVIVHRNNTFWPYYVGIRCKCAMLILARLEVIFDVILSQFRWCLIEATTYFLEK